MSHRPEAIACLIQCTNANPWIWSAWLELSGCIEDTDEVGPVKSRDANCHSTNAEQFTGIQRLLPRHPMSDLFGLRVMVDLHSPSDEDLRTIDSLLALFPDSLYLLGQKALIHYHQKGSISPNRVVVS
jgi:anaphase-promoting complex subunit 8